MKIAECKTLVALLMLFFLGISAAETASAQLVDVTECRKLAATLERYACYESLQPAGQEVQSAENLAVSESKAAEGSSEIEKNVKSSVKISQEDNVDSVDQFGTPEHRARITEDVDGREVLIDRVSSIRRIRKNQLEITLVSGQVWRQMIGKRFDLRKGDEVTITPLSMGKYYRLSSARSPGYIQVGRVR